MATRIYAPSSGAPAISPAVSASWTSTPGIFDRHAAFTTKQNTGLSTILYIVDGSAADQDHCFRQYVYGPIGAQTISAQTVEASFRISETALGNNLFLTMTIRVIAPDATTVRGTILALTRDDVEPVASGLRTRHLSATSSSVDAQDGDYIVIEIGLGGDPGLGSDHNGSIRIGDPTANGDLLAADGDGSEADDDPWFNFANTILPPGNPGGQSSYVSPVSNALAAVRSV